MRSLFGNVRLLVCLSILSSLGSCAHRKSFHKRQFLPGRNISLSQKLHFSKDAKAKTEVLTFRESKKTHIDPKDPILPNDLAEVQETILNRSATIAAAQLKPQKQLIHDTQHASVQNNPRFKKSNTAVQTIPVHKEAKAINGQKVWAIILTTLLYLVGFAGIVTALVLLTSGFSDIIFLLIGGASCILIFCAWTYWQKSKKKWDSPPTEPETPEEAPTEKKSSRRSITSKDILTAGLVVSGIGLLVYYLLVY